MDQSALVNQDQYTDHGETCERKIETIKKNVAELIKYQHEVIKEQSNQLLALIDVVNHNTKNPADTKQEMQHYSSSGSSTYPVHTILFVMIIVCVVSYLLYRNYRHR